MPEFSRGKVSEILHAMRPPKAAEVPEASRITVHAAVSRFAVLYEKIRNAVDYKDDHLIRKAAILRILKRQLTLEPDDAQVGVNLIRELIAARYLPNGVLPESLAADAAIVIRKYRIVSRVPKTRERHREWLLGIVAAELEELLDDHRREKALVHFLFEQLGDRITLRNAVIDETERRLQVYIACHRSLSKADDEMMSYKLVRAFHSDWIHSAEWLDAPAEMAHQMVEVEQRVRLQLAHPLGQKFLHAVKPWAISLGILREALLDTPDQGEYLLHHPEELRLTVGKIAARRSQESKAKLRRGTFRAMIYLFITKILLALAIEVPSELYLYQVVHRSSLMINVLFPPVLMFLVGSLIRAPGKDNVTRIQQAMEELLSVEGPKGKQIRMPSKHGVVGTFLFRLTYALTFLLSFGLVFAFLEVLNFTWISSSIFLFFLCIVSFFAFRLRLSAREYVVIERVDRFTSVLVDFFSLPILRAGQWLSESVSRINIFIFLFDFVIEAPYKIFLNVMEEWFAFMKEKKEELE